MLGMLLSGMILRNLFRGWIVDLPHTWTSKLWTLALASVIARAGLTLELSLLKKNAKAVGLLGVIPILCEAFCLAKMGTSLFLLPTSWAFMMAFGVASISPGVVVPLILNLLEKPMWTRSRLPPLMLAATGVDVLVATTGFGIAFSASFQRESDDNGLHNSWVIRGVQELGLGVLLGLLMGLFSISSLVMGWVILPFSASTSQTSKAKNNVITKYYRAKQIR
jgi:Kef-type K+ transport system membrane component KefB